MKNIFSIIVLSLLVMVFSSCDKDAGKLPNIAFKTGGNYLSADKIVAFGDTVTVGISASKAEDKDVLKTFDVTRYDDGATTGTSILNESLTGTQGDSYSRDMQIIARKQAGTELYKFTVINRDGLKNTVSLTLTVQ